MGNIGRLLSPSPASPPADTQPTRSKQQTGGSGDGRLQAGTYNLAGGNPDGKQAGNIASTTRTLAQQVVGGVDVVALQEMDVGTNDAAANLPAGMDDYNEYVLAQVASQAQGLQGEIEYTRTESVDAQGNPVTTITGTDSQGRTSQATLSYEYYTADGQPTQAGADDAVITVYNASVRTPDGLSDYTIVYGSSISHDGGTFGNSVLLGPDAGLQRDAQGNAMVSRHDLGANDPGGENRTALEVAIEAGGQEATVFSAHLTSGENDDEAAVQARLDQYATLAGLAEASGDNTLLLGDFNTGGVETVGPLAGSNDDVNDAAWSPRDPIDRLYVSADVDASGRDHINGGGSDHNMLVWDIDLNA